MTIAYVKHPDPLTDDILRQIYPLIEHGIIRDFRAVAATLGEKPFTWEQIAKGRIPCTPGQAYKCKHLLALTVDFDAHKQKVNHQKIQGWRNRPKTKKSARAGAATEW